MAVIASRANAAASEVKNGAADAGVVFPTKEMPGLNQAEPPSLRVL